MGHSENAINCNTEICSVKNKQSAARGSWFTEYDLEIEITELYTYFCRMLKYS